MVRLERAGLIKIAEANNEVYTKLSLWSMSRGFGGRGGNILPLLRGIVLGVNIFGFRLWNGEGGWSTEAERKRKTGRKRRLVKLILRAVKVEGAAIRILIWCQRYCKLCLLRVLGSLWSTWYEQMQYFLYAKYRLVTSDDNNIKWGITKKVGFTKEMNIGLKMRGGRGGGASNTWDENKEPLLYKRNYMFQD